MTDTQAKPTLEMQRNRAEQQARPDLEKRRNEAEQQALKTLDKDAIAAIEQTVQAIDSIAAGKTADALKGIEEATGKVNIVLARNPELALIPVSVETLIIDTAPRGIDDIEKLTDAVDAAILLDDFPTARALLDALRSEVRVRTYALPLGIYPTALQEAARLLDKDSQAASIALLAALNSLIWSDRVNLCECAWLFSSLSLHLLFFEDRASSGRGRFERRLINLPVPDHVMLPSPRLEPTPQSNRRNDDCAPASWHPADPS